MIYNNPTEVRVIKDIFVEINSGNTVCSCRTINPDRGTTDVGDYFVEVGHP